jgi:hypothetical protein
VRLVQACLGERSGRRDVTLVADRRGQQALRFQPARHVASRSGQGQGLPRRHRLRRVVAHAHGPVRAAQRHLGQQTRLLMRRVGRASRQRRCKCLHGVEVGELLFAPTQHLEAALARIQQPPAQAQALHLVAHAVDPPQRQGDAVQRRLVGVARPGMFGRTRVELARLRLEAGFGVMSRRHGQEVRRTGVGEADEPSGRTGVHFALGTLEHGLIGDLVQQLVLEGVFAHAARYGVDPGQGELAPGQRGQFARCLGIERGQRLVPEHQTDDAGLLQGQSLGRGQAVQPGLQHTCQGGRYPRREQPGGVDLPGFGVGANRALVDQHPDQLFHVEGVALGAANDEFAQGCGYRGKPLQQLARK